MSLIGIKNLVAPLQQRTKMVTLLIVTIVVLVIRLVTTSGPQAERDEEPDVSPEVEQSGFGDAHSTNAQLDGLFGSRKGAEAKPPSGRSRGGDPLLDGVLGGGEPRRVPSKPPPARGGGGGFDEVKKQLGL